MKISLLEFSNFLAFNIELFICKTIAAQEPVLDISGKQVKAKTTITHVLFMLFKQLLSHLIMLKKCLNII